MRTKTVITGIGLQAPTSAKRDTEIPVSFHVSTMTTAPNKAVPIQAVIPLKLTILDADGNPAEFSGYHAAVNGELKLNLSIPSNEKPGKWTLIAENLADGGKIQHSITIR